MAKSIIAVDLFCGAGGLTRGLLDAGIQVKKGYDLDERLKETYEKNNPGVKFYCKDVAKITKDELLKGLDLENNIFLLAGCAPCQPFSEINKNNIVRDKRKNLVLEFVRLVKETNPDLVFLENVPGLKNGKGKLLFRELENVLDEQNYFFESKVVDAKNYGVPQKRKRLILIASKHAQINIPAETHSNELVPYKTVRDTISKYPILRAGNSNKKVPNHACAKITKINLSRLKHIKKNGGSRTDLPPELQLECHTKHDGHTDTYGRMRWNAVAPTLTCRCTSISNGRFAHPTQTRGMSVREAAALQTFKDNYIFYGSFTENAKWVGNAVPVRLSRIFGEHFFKNGEGLMV